MERLYLHEISKIFYVSENVSRENIYNLRVILRHFYCVYPTVTMVAIGG